MNVDAYVSFSFDNLTFLRALFHIVHFVSVFMDIGGSWLKNRRSPCFHFLDGFVVDKIFCWCQRLCWIAICSTIKENSSTEKESKKIRCNLFPRQDIFRLWFFFPSWRRNIIRMCDIHREIFREVVFWLLALWMSKFWWWWLLFLCQWWRTAVDGHAWIMDMKVPLTYASSRLQLVGRFLPILWVCVFLSPCFELKMKCIPSHYGPE